MSTLETNQVHYIGYGLLVIGLLLALTHGGNVGGSGSTIQIVSYISGFVLAFIGAYLGFVYGRTKRRDEEQV